MGEYDPIMVVPQSFTHLTDETLANRDQIADNPVEPALENPLGTPTGVLFKGFFDMEDYAVQNFWEDGC